MPDRCLPRAKAMSLSKAERAATARKKKSGQRRGKTVVANTAATLDQLAALKAIATDASAADQQ